MIIDQIQEQFKTLMSERNLLAIAEDPVFGRFQAKRAEFVNTQYFQAHTNLSAALLSIWKLFGHPLAAFKDEKLRFSPVWRSPSIPERQLRAGQTGLSNALELQALDQVRSRKKEKIT